MGWFVPAALVLGVAVIAAGCSSNTSSSTTTSTTSSGTATTGSSSGMSIPAGATINVGSISTLTGPIASDFNGFAPGIQAYFAMINAQGGVNGHKLSLAWNLDDGGQPSQFTQLTHTLIDQDHAFAAMTASPWFSPNYFVETKTPTYGYNVTGNWQGPANLFAAGGSVQCYSCGVPTDAYLAKQLHSKGIAVISYGSAIASSYDACNTTATLLQQNGYPVSYVDTSAQYAGSYSSAVQRMQQTGTDLVISCMADTDNITMSRDIQQYGANIKQLWFNGYDQSFLDQYSNIMQGVYFNLSGNVPFEAVKYGNTYPGMVTYTNEMNKYQPAFVNSLVAAQGWQSAALFVDGVKAAGSNLTQGSLINATNKFAANDAAGMATLTDWTSAHSASKFPTCTSWNQVQGKTFVPTFTKGTNIWVCVPQNIKNPVAVPAPAGTPGT